jgi:hypothetical protein
MTMASGNTRPSASSDAFTRAVGDRRGLAHVREHHISDGRNSWRVAMVDAGLDYLGTLIPGEDAVALYDCSVVAEGRFVALVAVADLLACSAQQPMAVGGGTTWVLAPTVLAELVDIVQADRERRR